MNTVENNRETWLTNETVPTQYVNVNGSKIAYRRFGNQEGTPLIFLVHFVGTMDNWDPAITNPLSNNHPIILFNYKGMGTSEGEPRDSVSDMARDTVDFIHALGMTKVNLLGFSLGGFVAQRIAAENPDLVEKLIIAGTGPIGGKSISNVLSHVEYAQKDGPENVLVNLFFNDSETSIRAGKEFMKRLQDRTEGRDPAFTEESFMNQAKAIIDYGNEGNEDFSQLKSIKQDTLIVNGNNDIMVDSSNSFDLVKYIPKSKLVLWSDAGHGGLFQYHEDFVREVEVFLTKS